jgi:hypothetical protein
MVWQSLRFFLTPAKMKRQQPEVTHSSRTRRNLSPVDGSASSERTETQFRDVDDGEASTKPCDLPSTSSF